MAGKAFTAEQRKEAFWAKVDRSAGPDACWIWKGAVTSKWGYGCFQAGGRVLGAHKVAWLYTHGEPGRLCVLHRCDNRVCVNPAHLFLGTKKDNAADAVAKDRHARGERMRRNKLTAPQVVEIRERYQRTMNGKRTVKSNAKALSAEYGVNVGTIVHAALGHFWKHLK